MASRSILGLIIMLVTMLPSTAHAQSYALRYWLTPRTANAPEVEQALSEFTEWLRQERDPWRWSVFRVVVGDELGSWVLRSGGHSWHDLDERDEGFGTRFNERFEGRVLPLLRSATLQIEQGNESLTRRPEESQSASVFHITEWRLKPGGMADFEMTVSRMMESHEQAGQPYYARYYTVIGSNGPTVRRSVNYADWASFEGALRFGETLDSTHGPARAAEIRASYGQAVSTVKDFVLRAYPAMAVPGSG